MDELDFPDVAALPSRTASASVTLRYEDLAQDGRMKADAVPFAMGETCWRRLLITHPLSARLAREGVVPILRRLIVAVDETPLSTANELTADGRFGLAVAREPGSDRYLLELSTDVRGPRGRTFAKVARAGEIERVARICGDEVAEVAAWTHAALLVVLERHGRSLEAARVTDDRRRPPAASPAWWTSNARSTNARCATLSGPTAMATLETSASTTCTISHPAAPRTNTRT